MRLRISPQEAIPIFEDCIMVSNGGRRDSEVHESTMSRIWKNGAAELRYGCTYFFLGQFEMHSYTTKMTRRARRKKGSETYHICSAQSGLVRMSSTSLIIPSSKLSSHTPIERKQLMNLLLHDSDIFWPDQSIHPRSILFGPGYSAS